VRDNREHDSAGGDVLEQLARPEPSGCAWWRRPATPAVSRVSGGTQLRGLNSAPVSADRNPVLLGTSLIIVGVTPFVVVLVHELGHACFVLWACDDPVHVTVGRQPPMFTASIGRLDLSVHLLSARSTPSGVARTFASFSWDDYAAFALAGPFANVGLALLTVPFLYDGMGHLRWNAVALAGFSTFTAFVNLVPYRRHGYRSDGLVALESWRHR
jgi:hypothetical protein